MRAAPARGSVRCLETRQARAFRALLSVRLPTHLRCCAWSRKIVQRRRSILAWLQPGENFLPEDVDAPGRRNPHTYLASLDAQNDNRDIISDHQGFTLSSR